jgi:hypothetical protein
MLTTGYSISLPVFAASKVKGGAYLVEGEVLGSAFALGSEFMVTAGHVVDAVGSAQVMVVGLQSPDGFFKTAVARDIERLAGDLALLRVEFVVPGSGTWFNRFKWRDEPIEPFEFVRTVGYGYGLQIVREHRSVIVRAFQGYIVARRDEFLPVGWPGEPFAVYELSFTAPRGLSGAPLLNSMGNVVVHGVVIGNSESRMLVFRSEERTTEPEALTSVEQYEALTLGVAVQSGALLNQNSSLLGGTVREHLAKNSLLA